MLQVTFNEADRILLDMADCAEQANHYDQSEWGRGCGSPACMLGTYGWLNPASVVSKYLIKQVAYLEAVKDKEAVYVWDEATSLYPKEEFVQVLSVLDITEEEFDELFEGDGCGGAKKDGKAAAAFVREFVRLRALARVNS